MPCGHGRNNEYTLEKILERRHRALIRKSLEQQHHHKVTSKEIDVANLALKHPDQRFIVLTFLSVDLEAYYKIIPLLLSPSPIQELKQLAAGPESILQIEMSNDHHAPESSSSTTSKIVLPYYLLADKSDPLVPNQVSGSIDGSGLEVLMQNLNNDDNGPEKNPKKNPKKKGKKKNKKNNKKPQQEDKGETSKKPKPSEIPASSSSPVKPSPVKNRDDATGGREKSDEEVDKLNRASISDRCADVSNSNSDVSENDEVAASSRKKPTEENLSIVQTGAKFEIITVDRADCSVDASTSSEFLPVASGKKGRRNLTGQTSQTGQPGRVVSRFVNGKNRFSVWQEKGRKSAENGGIVINEQSSNSSRVKNEIWANKSNEVTKIESSDKSESNKKPEPNQGANSWICRNRGRQASKKNNNVNCGVVIEELKSPVFKKDDFPSLPLPSKINSSGTQKVKAAPKGNRRANQKAKPGETGSKNQCEKPVEKTESSKPKFVIRAVGPEEKSAPEIQNPNLEIKNIEAQKECVSQSEIEIPKPDLVEIESIREEEASVSVSETQPEIEIKNPSAEIQSVKAEEKSGSEIEIQNPNSGTETIRAEEDAVSEPQTSNQIQNPNSQKIEPELQSGSEIQTQTEIESPSSETTPPVPEQIQNPNLETETNAPAEQSSNSSFSSSSKSCGNEPNESNNDTCPSDDTQKATTATNDSDAFATSSSSSACSSPASIAPISPVTDIPCLEIGKTEKTIIVDDSDLNKIKEAVLSALKVQLKAVQALNAGTAADYEKLLHCTSPVLGRLPSGNASCNCTGEDEYKHAICVSHEIPKMSLRRVWQWYEEPGCYGVEVKCTDFKAYFVPYLSAVQLFNAKNGMAESEIGSELASLPIFSKLLPKQQSKEKEGNGSEDRPVLEKKSCGGGELVFEFFEFEQPPFRLAAFEKIKQLLGGVKPSRGYIYGDPGNLEAMDLEHLHPSSWYSIAWYPAYRVPEGLLKVAFLTYHSLGYFVPQTGTRSTSGHFSFSLPVVGFQYYNDQGESWFELRNQRASLTRSNSSELIRERLSSLSKTSSVMARAKVPKNGELSTNHHGDFEFFRSRSRPFC